MASVKYSISAYIADGSTTDYLITWDYLDDDHISVYVDDLSSTDPTASHKFIELNSTTLRITDTEDRPITAGLEIEIRRETPIDSRAVTFTDGSALLAEDLNKNSDYLLYAMQEAIDTVDIAAQDSAQDAKDATEAFRDEAEGFKDEAEAAANEAEGHANDAKGYLDSVEADANAAIAAAAAAKVSQDAAKVSQDAAKVSEDNAEGHAQDAANSAASIVGDKDAAAASAAAAKVSEDNAKASENAAKSSENNAKSSENVSITKANEAADSAAAAAQSALDAAEAANFDPDDYVKSADVKTDGNLSQNSDAYIPTQKAVKTYVDTSLEAYSPTSEAISTNSFPNVDGVQTTFSLTREPVNEDNCQVYFSGVYQSKSNFSVVGSNITFSTAPPKGTDVEIMIVYAVTVDEDPKGGSLFKGNNGTVGSPSGLSDIFRVNAQSLNVDVTINADENASCAGPLAVATGATLTVTAGGNLSIV